MKYILPKPVDLELVRLKVIDMLLAQRAVAIRNQHQQELPLVLQMNDCEEDYTTTSYLSTPTAVDTQQSGSPRRAAADDHFLRE